MKHWKTLAIAAAVLTAGVELAQAQQAYSWRYYRPTNTGIQGDYNEAIYIGPDNDPWIGGYHPGFEEGGIAKFIQAENRWINISNVDYPVIGHPDDTGTTRVSEIVADAQGNLWMGTGRGALKFNPSIGPSSLVKYSSANSGLPGGYTDGVEIAPDGTLWFSAHGVFWGPGGLTRYNPATNIWTTYPGYGDGTVAAQTKQGGGYYIWATQNLTGQIARLDSTAQTWTTFTQVTNAPWSLPGKACTDAAGNTWLYRLTGPSYASQVLDCRRPDGSWIGPAVPTLPAVIPAIWAFRAFGNMQALLADGMSQIWRFNGTSWQNLGIWRDGAYTQDLGIDSAGNVWACGVGGAAKRDAITGVWQRYRVTNTSQYDFFNEDLTIDPATGNVYACANAASGIGGMEKFDGVRWTGFNNEHYGLGIDWPFPTDNSQALASRPSNGHIAVNPTFNGVREWTGSAYLTLDNGLTVNPKRLVEDSMGRLWSIDTYYSMRYHDGSAWTQVGIAGWGGLIQRDPERPGTIWATTGYEVTRTDGVYRYSRTIPDFPELDTSATSPDSFSGLASAPGGIAWIGATVHFGVFGNGGALIRLDSNSGTYQMLQYNQGWPLPGQYVSPLAVTSDGRLWMAYNSDYPSTDAGLCWYDGVNVGTFPAPPGGVPQWGGLPHAGIKDLEVRQIPGGYELWMSCISRGIAVLTVLDQPAITPFCFGDGSAGSCPCSNSGSPGHGCQNSAATGGSLTTAVGVASLSADTLQFTSSGELPTALSILLQGNAVIAPTIFGDGLRCVGGSLKRLYSHNASGGVVTAPQSGDPSVSARSAALGDPIPMGTTRNYQVYYRDANASFCPDPPGNTFNVSNAFAILWGS